MVADTETHRADEIARDGNTGIGLHVRGKYAIDVPVGFSSIRQYCEVFSQLAIRSRLLGKEFFMHNECINYNSCANLEGPVTNY